RPLQDPPARVVERREGRRSFSTPRAYASAVTRYFLTSAKTDVIGRPACSERATWTEWTCTATVRSTGGPAGDAALVFRCSAVASRGAVCGPVLPSVPNARTDDS